ncbi:AfsR/SARP family transcriptional regulator, partial [Streptomyces murinus]|uniref:AfsR/SARP family transcriptional regulator n=1 Tax=Streptomyces murinus TaxID=33900 RepID=UPI001180F801
MKGRRELRFGLLGPLVLYDRPSYDDPLYEGPLYDTPGGTRSYETPYDAVHATPGHTAPGHVTFGHAALDHAVPGEGAPDTAVRAIGSPKVRALLAALLLEPGRVVSVESLKDALWGGAPPASAQASLHNHVTRLRRLLDDPERLRSVPPGYLLRVDQGELDVDVFDALVTDARAAHARQDWPGVVRSCTKALALWRGTPLSGLPDLGGHTLVPRLEEARLILLKWRYDAELALGGTRLTALVPELSALVAEHPFREAYHRQLMLALHRTGRQAEALAVHRDLRARLIEELGVEPGPAMREAHVEVLRGSDGSDGSDAWLPEDEEEDEEEDEGAREGGGGGESRRPTEAARPAGERNQTEHSPARGGDADLKPVTSVGPRADEREGEDGGEHKGVRDDRRGGEREGEPDG